ncbi:MAG TPA: TonB C-terminal domain-containing protein [Drouetiella sp.]
MLGSRLFIALVCAASAVVPACADYLQGNVQKEDDGTRLTRPANLNGMTQQGTFQPPTFRIGRPQPAPDFGGGRQLTGLVDTGGFSAPLSGSATDSGGRLGVLQPAQFDNSNKKFDLGAERGDKQLVLAWERWHHQLSQAIYERWSEVANRPGSATLKIIVTRNRELTPIMVHSSGNAAFDRDLIAAVMSLNGNPGLTFPSKSQRQEVAFEADYVASTNVKPGFSWVKNDYEKVHESY